MGAANPIRVLHKMESSLDSSVLSNTGVFRGRAEGAKVEEMGGWNLYLGFTSQFLIYNIYNIRKSLVLYTHDAN